jgi:hypothetical protein
MPTYDFAKTIQNRRGQPFTTTTIGLQLEGIWDDPKEYAEPLKAGTMFELLLLYTVDRKPGQQPGDPSRYLTEEEKRNRFALTLKLRDCQTVEIDERELKLLRTCINVLAVEQNGYVHQFLDQPEQ